MDVNLVKWGDGESVRDALLGAVRVGVGGATTEFVSVMSDVRERESELEPSLFVEFTEWEGEVVCFVAYLV